MRRISRRRSSPARAATSWIPPGLPRDLSNLVVADMRIDQGVALPGKFGYATLERGDGEWLLQDFDQHGAVLARCHLRQRKVACDPPG